jgi:hypothetical protein
MRGRMRRLLLTAADPRGGRLAVSYYDRPFGDRRDSGLRGRVALGLADTSPKAALEE